MTDLPPPLKALLTRRFNGRNSIGYETAFLLVRHAYLSGLDKGYSDGNLDGYFGESIRRPATFGRRR